MKKRPKSKTVSKFGGVTDIAHVIEKDAVNAPVKDVGYDVKDLEVQSTTHLEDDQGGGGAAIVRCFEFGMNLEAFGNYQPTKQELFNSHLKGIEVALWRDGMKIMTEVLPRVAFDQENFKYKIFVGAQPMKGHILREQPKTLAEQIHGPGNE